MRSERIHRLCRGGMRESSEQSKSLWRVRKHAPVDGTMHRRPRCVQQRQPHILPHSEHVHRHAHRHSELRRVRSTRDSSLFEMPERRSRMRLRQNVLLGNEHLLPAPRARELRDMRTALSAELPRLRSCCMHDRYLRILVSSESESDMRQQVPVARWRLHASDRIRRLASQLHRYELTSAQSSEPLLLQRLNGGRRIGDVQRDCVYLRSTCARLLMR